MATTSEKLYLSSDDKLTFISNFATMLAAGISILEAVDALMEDVKGNQKKLLLALREDLVGGKHVYACFARFPGVFDKVTVNIIKASEEAGTLDKTLRDIRDTIQKQIEFRDKVKSALAYPLLIGVVFSAILLIILVVVVPQISTVFISLGVPLPWPTKVMIFMSNAIIHNTIPLIVGTILTIIGVIILYKKNRNLVFAIVFSLPLISDLVRQIDLVNLTRSLSLLLNSGIPIISSLELVHDVVLKKEVTQIVEQCQKMVLTGKTLSEGLRYPKGVVPSTVIKVIEVGERTGTLDTSIQDVSNYLDYQVSKTLKTITTLIEPIMLVVIGALVGGMMLAVMAPIYGVVGQINAH